MTSSATLAIPRGSITKPMATQTNTATRPEPSPTAATPDPTRKFTAESDLEKFRAGLLQNFEKRDGHPTGYVYVPTNMAPEFAGPTEAETYMKYHVVKFHFKDGKATEAVTDPRDSETSRLVYCEDFLRDHKRI